MGMHLSGQDEDDVIGVINTTPLVDVMLVLLIIFLITIPVVTTSIKVDLPKESNVVRETRPDNVILSVDKRGQVYLYDTPVRSDAQLKAQMQKYAAMQPQPQVQIRGDGDAEFATIGRVLHAVQRAGMAKVDFITEPSVR